MADYPRDIFNVARLSIPTDHTLADTMYERVVSAIQDFEQALDDEHEVGARLANFGSAITVAIEDIGYHNPYLFKIYGFTPEGDRCTLLQHVSQLNILLVAVKAKQKPARRVGFLSEPVGESAE